jgi:HAD superfamily hydrolase (TIGR01509 family)
MSQPNTNESDASLSQTSHSFGPNTVRGVALDMDGLLFDTEGLYWGVGDTVLQRRGYRFSKELQQRMMGRTGVAAMQQMVELHGLADSPEQLLAESSSLFAEIIAEGAPPMPGLDSWIGFLQQLGLPFGLATSSQRKFVDVIFESIPWRDSLTFILTGDDVTRGKPDPQMYLLAAEAMSIEPSQMLVLEDSGNGCAAAVAAGAVTVAVPSEHTQEQPFDGAVLIADSLTDARLWELVKSLV